MSGKPREGQTRSVQIIFRTTPDGAKAIDRVRGDLSRSDYLRMLVKQDYQRKVK